MNIVSFGGGTNSAAMIIGMYEKRIPIDLILFSDTGGEQPHTYSFVNIFNHWLNERGLPEITFVFYSTKDGNRLTLEDHCLHFKSLPSIAYGYKQCSYRYKIAPQEKFCNNHPQCREVWKSGDKINKYIGFDAGEQRRISHAKTKDEADNKYATHYPLFEWGWTREHCIEVIKNTELPEPGKSSCFFCPSMKKKEIEALYVQNPDLFQRAVALEVNALETLTTVKGLGRNWSWQSYISAWLKAKEFESMQLTLYDYIESVSGCICDAPCGCYDG